MPSPLRNLAWSPAVGAGTRPDAPSVDAVAPVILLGNSHSAVPLLFTARTFPASPTAEVGTSLTVDKVQSNSPLPLLADFITCPAAVGALKVNWAIWPNQEEDPEWLQNTIRNAISPNCCAYALVFLYIYKN